MLLLLIRYPWYLKKQAFEETYSQFTTVKPTDLANKIHTKTGQNIAVVDHLWNRQVHDTNAKLDKYKIIG